MKFRKNLQRMVNLSDVGWSEAWIDYKKLKKLIKDIEPRPASDSVTDAAEPLQDIREFPHLLLSPFARSSVE